MEENNNNNNGNSNVMDEMLRTLDRDRDLSKSNLRRIKLEFDKTTREAQKEISSLEDVRKDEDGVTDEKKYGKLKTAQKEIQLAHNYYDLDKEKIKKSKGKETEKLEFDFNTIDTKNNRKKENITISEQEQVRKLDFRVKEVQKVHNQKELEIKDEGKKNGDRITKSRQRVISENELTIKEVNNEFDKQLNLIHDFQANTEADYTSSMGLIQKNLAGTISIVTSQKSRIENTLNSSLRPLRNQMNRELASANAALASAIEQRDIDGEEEQRVKIKGIHAEFEKKVEFEEKKKDDLISQQLLIEKDAHMRAYKQRADAEHTKLKEQEKNTKEYKTKKLLREVSTKRLDVERDIRLLELDTQRDLNFLIVEKDLALNNASEKTEVAKVQRDITDVELQADFERKTSDIDVLITKAELSRKIKEARFLADNKNNINRLERDIKLAKLDFEVKKINLEANNIKERDLLKELESRTKHINSMVSAVVKKMNADEHESFSRAKTVFFTELKIGENIRDLAHQEYDALVKRWSNNCTFDLSEKGKEYGREYGQYISKLDATTNESLKQSAAVFKKESDTVRKLMQTLNDFFSDQEKEAIARVEEIKSIVEDKNSQDLQTLTSIIDELEAKSNEMLNNLQTELDNSLDSLNTEIREANEALEHYRIEADKELETLLAQYEEDENNVRRQVERFQSEADDKLDGIIKEQKEIIKVAEDKYKVETRQVKDEFADAERKMSNDLSDFEFEVQKEIEEIELNYESNLKNGIANIDQEKDDSISNLNVEFGEE